MNQDIARTATAEVLSELDNALGEGIISPMTEYRIRQAMKHIVQLEADHNFEIRMLKQIMRLTHLGLTADCSEETRKEMLRNLKEVAES